MDQEPEPVRVFVEVDEQVAGGLGDLRCGGVGGGAGYVDSAVVEFDDEQDIQPGQPDRLDDEEVRRERPGGLGAQELRPARFAAPGRRSQVVARLTGLQAQVVASEGRMVRTEVADTRHAELAALADDATAEIHHFGTRGYRCLQGDPCIV